MTAAAQTALPVEGLTLPIDIHALAALDLPPLSRGRYYAALDLHSEQIACIEEGLRLLRRGEYPEGR